MYHYTVIDCKYSDNKRKHNSISASSFVPSLSEFRPPSVLLDLARELVLGKRMLLHFFDFLYALLGVLRNGVCQFSHFVRSSVKARSAWHIASWIL